MSSQLCNRIQSLIYFKEHAAYYHFHEAETMIVVFYIYSQLPCFESAPPSTRPYIEKELNKYLFKRWNSVRNQNFHP